MRIDAQVHPSFIKYKLKEICSGTDVKYAEINWLVNNLLQKTVTNMQYSNVVDIELGMPGHKRTRQSSV